MARFRLARPRLVPGLWGRLDPRPRVRHEVEREARALLGRLSLAEKLDQMSGDTPLLRGMLDMAWAYNSEPLPAGENHRLGIPGIRFSDGPRGVVMGRSTCFPVPMARGAAWDLELEEEIGDAIGVEARAQGANLFAGVCVNLLRHPAWGRAQETYGEEPHALGELGAALVRGVQRHVMACVKHYAANSMEDARFRVDVRIGARALHEVYLPHFRRIVDEGVAAVMTAYNRVNGRHCGHHPGLLREILKRDWGFQGFVMSDFVLGIRSAGAAAAGLDLEMPFRWRFGRGLRRRVEQGRIPETVIDEAVLRLLRQKQRFASVGEPDRYDRRVVAGDAHRALAREAARKSIVLLQNRGESALLPLDLESLGRIAVIGRLASAPNLGDVGSSRVRPPSVVTILDGIRAAAGRRCRVDSTSGRSLTRAAAAAREADVAVVVAGLGPRQEGENLLLRGGDRDRLGLELRDEELIRTVARANGRCAVVLVGGSAIVTESWREEVPAILMAWYPGMEGGHAVAELLFGAVSPSGKLPIAFPRSADDLPPFDKRARAIEYGLFHGQRWLDREGRPAAFPLGHGLSYTRFSYANLKLASERVARDATLVASIEVTNAGARSGDEVVQLYVSFPGSAVERPRRELRGFARLALAPGETRTARFEIPVQSLAWYDEAGPGWVVDPGEYDVGVGPSSEPERQLSARFRVMT